MLDTLAANVGAEQKLRGGANDWGGAKVELSVKDLEGRAKSKKLGKEPIWVKVGTKGPQEQRSRRGPKLRVSP